MLQTPSKTRLIHLDRHRPTYRSHLTVGGLRLQDSRTLARLLRKRPDTQTWRRELFETNVLRLGATASIARVVATLQPRLVHLGDAALRAVVEGTQVEAVQLLMAGALKQDRLLRDFFTDHATLALQRRRQALTDADWAGYLAECEARDDAVSAWSESTRRRLRQGVYAVLSEAGYLADAKSRRLQWVPVLETVREALRGAPAEQSLGWMECAG